MGMTCRREPAGHVSTVLQISGYCLFWVGVLSRSWRWEIGYLYGLWLRCDQDACVHLSAGLQSYLLLVRCGIAISVVLFTVNIICLLLEAILRLSDVHVRQVTRSANVGCLAATFGAILAACSLGLYGWNTVMLRERSPVLLWGFGATGTSVILLLLGNILKVMGPASSWQRDFPCLASRRCGGGRVAGGLYCSTSADSYLTQRGSVNAAASPGVDKRELVPCCRQVSLPSSHTSDTNYRHYEEISFDEMPAPPPEILYQPPWGNTHEYFVLQSDYQTPPPVTQYSVASVTLSHQTGSQAVGSNPTWNANVEPRGSVRYAEAHVAGNFRHPSHKTLDRTYERAALVNSNNYRTMPSIGVSSKYQHRRLQEASGYTQY
ncbi:uncharacterized protein LOC131954778 [Physella acuta]|uniref:uncharacterized protein LOC131954778 n=1 Tax=Physella acuta TaxID=109671 RepID=UPI0027DDD790|nr:uncharacterized protein LOC131954778 [Physella acuta]